MVVFRVVTCCTGEGKLKTAWRSACASAQGESYRDHAELQSCALPVQKAPSRSKLHFCRSGLVAVERALGRSQVVGLSPVTSRKQEPQCGFAGAERASAASCSQPDNTCKSSVTLAAAQRLKS